MEVTWIQRVHEHIGQQTNVLRVTLPTPNFTYPWLGKYTACADPTNYASCDGLVKDVLDYYLEALNASIDIKVAHSHVPGRKLENGTCIGSIKDVRLVR
jgi:hypothetical protein